MNIKIKSAVAVIIPFESDSKVLCVTRPNSNLIAFPGGKVEKNESEVQAAVREVLEETGLIINQADLLTIFSGTSSGRGETTYWLTAFLHVGNLKQNSDLYSSLKTEVNLENRVVEIEDLENAEIAAFSKNNKKIIKNLKLLNASKVK